MIVHQWSISCSRVGLGQGSLKMFVLFSKIGAPL